MKKTLFIIALTALVSACQNGDSQSVDAVLQSGDLTEIKEKRDALNQEQQRLKSDIERLDAFIRTQETPDRPALVTAKVIQDTIFNHYIEVQGNVDTDQNLVLNGEFSGVLTEIRVKEGQHVSKGQVLARIDDGGLASQVAQQEVQLELARTTFERQERLWNKSIGSEMQYLQAKTNFESAENVLKQLHSQLAKTEIRAPYDGIIDALIADPGQLVMPGQTPILRIVNLNDMYVKASIPENYLKSVQKNSEVIIELPSIQEEFVGIVRQVSNFINPANRSFDIEVALPNKDGLIKPNLIATVKVNDYRVDKAIVIPENILQENAAGEKIVYRYKTKTDSIGEAQRIHVVPGKSYQNKVEIIEGISSGDTLVIEGSRNLRDGQKIIIKN